MPPDMARLREQLARQLDALWQLDVVESAEYLVRSHHQQVLADELAELSRDLLAAQRGLDMARAGELLTVIMAAEERVCGITRQAARMQRRSRDQDLACLRARTDYLAKRQHLWEIISGLQRQILRTAD